MVTFSMAPRDVRRVTIEIRFSEEDSDASASTRIVVVRGVLPVAAVERVRAVQAYKDIIF